MPLPRFSIRTLMIALAVAATSALGLVRQEFDPLLAVAVVVLAIVVITNLP